MPDPIVPAAAPTTDSNLLGSLPAVNPVQAPGSTPAPANPAAPATSLDVSGMIASYEQRLRNLMSEKDKAINERNQAITAQTDLQQQLTSLQNQTSTSLTGAAQAAQTAIDEAKQLRARVSVLEGEVLRYKMLSEHTELLPYADFVPVTTDENMMREAVQKLQTIRQQDLERSRVTQFPGQQYQQLPPTTPTTPGTTPATPNVYGLYQQRPTMAPTMPNIPPSSPAQMHPAGAGNSVDSIDQMLREARQSGDPSAFEQAIQRASLLARQSIDAQLGRS